MDHTSLFVEVLYGREKLLEVEARDGLMDTSSAVLGFNKEEEVTLLDEF